MYIYFVCIHHILRIYMIINVSIYLSIFRSFFLSFFLSIRPGTPCRPDTLWTFKFARSRRVLHSLLTWPFNWQGQEGIRNTNAHLHQTLLSLEKNKKRFSNTDSHPRETLTSLGKIKRGISNINFHPHAKFHSIQVGRPRSALGIKAPTAYPR